MNQYLVLREMKDGKVWRSLGVFEASYHDKALEAALAEQTTTEPGRLVALSQHDISYAEPEPRHWRVRPAEGLSLFDNTPPDTDDPLVEKELTEISEPTEVS